MLTKCLHNILVICCEEFEVSIEDVKSKSKEQEFVYARMAFSMIARIICFAKYSRIGELINRSSSGILYLIKKGKTNKNGHFMICLTSIKKRVMSL